MYVNTTNIHLNSKEELLLHILIESKGQILSFDSIKCLIWNTNIISESTLKNLIYRVRTKLNYMFIEIVPNIGCKIC